MFENNYTDVVFKRKKMQHFSFHDPQWSFIYFKNSKAILEFDSSSSVDKCVKYSKKKVFLEKSRIRSSKYQKNGTKLTFDSLTLSLIFRQKLKTKRKPISKLTKRTQISR